MSAFTKEKIAVFAPMERARVMMTVTVNPGLRLSWRTANRRYPLFSIDYLLAAKIYHAILCREYVARSA
jgi:hypothetical protein